VTDEWGQIYQIERRFQRDLLRRERSAASEMVKYYGQIWGQIQRQLTELTRKISEARAAGEEVSPAWLFQQQRLESLQLQVEVKLRDFARYAEDIIRSQQDKAIAAAQDHAEQLVMASLGKPPPGIVLRWDRLPQEAVQDIVGFLQDGSPLRTLLDDLPGEAGQAVADALVRGVALGLNPREVARQVRREMGMSLTRALRIARTETLRAYREASLRSYRANRDIIKGWIWHAHLGPRTCAACIAMHGTVHRLDEKLDDHPNGRCAPIPLTKSWKELGQEYGIDLSDLPDTRVQVERGTDWFARQPEDVQRRILGHAGYEAWRAGAVRLEDFVGRKRSKEWGPHRYRRSLRELLGGRESKAWLMRARLVAQIEAMSPADVLVVGELRASMVTSWTVPTNRKVVLTGERRWHYLERHPEMRQFEALLRDVLLEPDAVCRNRTDEEVAIFYRRHDVEHYLRVVVLMQRGEKGKYKHSILSFRLAKVDEYRGDLARAVWRKKK